MTKVTSPYLRPVVAFFLIFPFNLSTFIDYVPFHTLSLRCQADESNDVIVDVVELQSSGDTIQMIIMMIVV